MDPDANIKEQLDICDEIDEILNGENELSEDDKNAQVTDKANRLVDLVMGLNTWMSHQGALPKTWAEGRK